VKKNRVAVFGSTGSIGRSVLDVARHLPGRIEVKALAANRSVKLITRQAREFKAKQVVLTDFDACETARKTLGPRHSVGWGPSPMIDIAASGSIDTVVMAMSGTAGLLAVLSALGHGKRVALATKEILVGFGEHVMRLARRHGGTVLPIDSELAAVHQCLGTRSPGDIRRVILTASGGPFWRTGLPQDASTMDVLRHPTWNMGRKITVDSATMMNKGLEVIETVRLFGLRPEQVEPVIHPQSIVHSLVEFRDGSVLAQLSEPDMHLPIQYCLTFPDRLPSLTRTLDLSGAGRLDFHPINRNRFPCLKLAFRALELGEAGTCCLNAANQVAVEAFLERRIAFGDIPRVIARVLAELAATSQPARPGIARLLRLESWAAAAARQAVAEPAARRARRKE
jgi:1-deoxy-D-xylulose-5-phosphate reductoisomerase